MNSLNRDGEKKEIIKSKYQCLIGGKVETAFLLKERGLIPPPVIIFYRDGINYEFVYQG